MSVTGDEDMFRLPHMQSWGVRGFVPHQALPLLKAERGSYPSSVIVTEQAHEIYMKAKGEEEEEEEEDHTRNLPCFSCPCWWGHVTHTRVELWAFMAMWVMVGMAISCASMWMVHIHYAHSPPKHPLPPSNCIKVLYDACQMDRVWVRKYHDADYE